MSEPGARAPRPAPGSCVDTLAEILLDSLGRLAGAGEVEAACRLAGRAYVALRVPEPGLARRFDVLLHRLTPKLEEGPAGGAG